MSIPKAPLVDFFIPAVYDLTEQGSLTTLVVLGSKVGRPSKKIIFHQQNLKINSAKVIWKNKNKQIEHEVIRISYLPKINHVRIHTSQLLFPGEYEITLSYSGVSSNDLAALRDKDLSSVSLRNYLPSIDEPTARENVILRIS